MWSDHMIEPVCWVAVCEAVRENLRKSCFWHWIWMAWLGKILNHIIFAIASVSVLFKSSRQGVSFLKSSFKILIWIDVYFTSSLCLKVHRGPTSTLKSKRLSWHQDFQQKREKEGIQIILCQLGLRFPKDTKWNLKHHLGLGLLASWPPPLLRLHLSRLETTWAVNCFSVSISISSWAGSSWSLWYFFIFPGWKPPGRWYTHIIICRIFMIYHDRQIGPRSLL